MILMLKYSVNDHWLIKCHNYYEIIKFSILIFVNIFKFSCTYTYTDTLEK